MSQLSRDVGSHAPGHRLEHQGTVYQFRFLDLAALAEFEREKYRLARESLREFKDDYGPQEYAKRLDELRARYDRHEFSFESDPAYVQTAAGLSLILRVMLPGVSEADIATLFRARQQDLVDTVRLVVEESMPRPPVQGVIQ